MLKDSIKVIKLKKLYQTKNVRKTKRRVKSINYEEYIYDNDPVEINEYDYSYSKQREDKELDDMIKEGVDEDLCSY